MPSTMRQNAMRNRRTDPDRRDPDAVPWNRRASPSRPLCLPRASNNSDHLDRIRLFETAHKNVLMNLSLNLKAVISLRLVVGKDGKRLPATEVLINTPMIRDLIRRGEVHEVKEAMDKSLEEGMHTFDQSLFKMYKDGKIELEEALRKADSRDGLALKIRLARVARERPYATVQARPERPGAGFKEKGQRNFFYPGEGRKYSLWPFYLRWSGGSGLLSRGARRRGRQLKALVVDARDVRVLASDRRSARVVDCCTRQHSAMGANRHRSRCRGQAVFSNASSATDTPRSSTGQGSSCSRCFEFLFRTAAAQCLRGGFAGVICAIVARAGAHAPPKHQRAAGVEFSSGKDTPATGQQAPPCISTGISPRLPRGAVSVRAPLASHAIVS